MRLRRLARRLWRLLAWGGLLLLIFTAAVVGLASQLLPLLERHPDAVAGWLSERIRMPVSVQAVEARWNRAGPRLTLSGLRIGQAPQVLDIDRARLQVNIYAGLWPGTALTELRIDAPELALHRNAQGHWRLDGIGRRDAGGDGGSALDLLDRFGVIEVLDARLDYHDAKAGRSLVAPRIDLRMQHDRGRLRFGVLLHDADQARWRLAGDLARDLREGRLYLEGLGQDWAGLAQGWQWRGLSLDQARGDLKLWLDFADGQTRQVQLEAALSALVLERAVDGASDRHEQGTDSAAAMRRLDLGQGLVSARWQHQGEQGWHLHVPQWQWLHSGPEQKAEEALQGLHLARDDAGLLRMQLDALELAPWLRLTALLPELPEALREVLQRAMPQGELHRVRLLWADAGQYRLQAEVSGLGWQAAGPIPALSGINGALDGDAQAWRLRLVPGVWQLNADGVMRAPFRPQASGELVAHDDGTALRIEATRLELQESDYHIIASGGVGFPHQGSGARLDVQVEVPRAEVVAAKRFWPINVMPPKAVSWLDMALQGGHVSRGHARFNGALRDWPFRRGQGHFEAVAELEAMRIKYQRDWPIGEAVSGEARFINNGMTLDLQGRVGAVEVNRLSGGIEDFKNARLRLDMKGTGSGHALLRLLRASSLQARYGQYMEGLKAGGHGVVGLNLDVVLTDKSPARVQGQVAVQDMDIEVERWNLDFAGLNGEVAFSERGFSAEALGLHYAGQPARLAVAAGGHARSDSNAFEARLSGQFPVAVLSGAHASARLLETWLQGSSEWSFHLHVPNAGQGDGVQLRLRSDLVGTAIDLPAPLGKRAPERRALDLRLRLPWQDSELDLHLGNLHLRARPSSTGELAGLAAFGKVDDERLPTRGIRVRGRVAQLDSTAWMELMGKATGLSGPGLESLDLQIGDLRLFGQRFGQTRLELVPQPQAMQIRFTGKAIDGRLSIPAANQSGQGIQAHLTRLHWPFDAEESKPKKTDPASNIKPATIPALRLDVEDLRFGEARLGRLQLEARAHADGLEIERLDAHSDAFELKGRGQWRPARTELSLNLSAADAGNLLDALGYSRLVQGGGLSASAQLGWIGAPGDFDWGQVDGRLALNLSKGRLLEVEPGAGRLFGLLSLAEIPRRLALDFSDFFKSGLGFNAMSGDFVITAGQAVTENFLIDAPAAQIHIRGRTGLKTRDYDQIIEILPNAGSMLPAIGAVTAGPAGAVVGAVAQAVLRRPLSEMARIVYHLGGTWAEPQMQEIERDEIPVAVDQAAQPEPAPQPTPLPEAETFPLQQDEPESGGEGELP